MRRAGKGFSGVETPLFEVMLAVGQLADEGLVAEQVQVDDAAAAVEEYVAEDVFHAAIPSPPPHDIPSPLQEPSSPPHQQQSSPQALPQDAEFLNQLQQVLNICSALSKHVENLENDNAAQKLVIVKLKARFKKLEKANKKEMEVEDQEIIKSINETPAQKAAKRRKLSEEAQEVEDLRNRLEVVEDKDDDVFVDATPFAQKVPVVDYQIVLVDNKPRWTRCYMEKSKECSWFGIGEKMEAADFM
nr:hypothetical protein [Tanacetum cinerariifolium]